jgi:hypothetical protein
MWNKAYILALMILGCTIAGGFMLGIFELVFNTRISGFGLSMQFLSGFAVGGNYSQHQGILIPKSLKLSTSMYHALITILITPIGVSILNIHIPASSLWYLALGASILGFIFVCWGLGFGSSSYMKKKKIL